MEQETPQMIYDWKHKIYLRVVGENKEGLTVLDPRTDSTKRIRWAQISPKKRYRPCN